MGKKSSKYYLQHHDLEHTVLECKPASLLEGKVGRNLCPRNYSIVDGPSNLSCELKLGCTAL